MQQDGCWNSSLKIIQNIAWRVKLYFVRCVEINSMWEISAETTFKHKCPCNSKKTVKCLKTNNGTEKWTFFWKQCFVLFFVIFLKQWRIQTYFALRWTVSVSDLYWRTVVNVCPTRYDTKVNTCVWISDRFGGLFFWILEPFYPSNDARNCLASSDWMTCYINFDLEMKQQIKAVARNAEGYTQGAWGVSHIWTSSANSWVVS